jgi:dipeptidyl aminopeptidase/acylaminoacyl peptidase
MLSWLRRSRRHTPLVLIALLAACTPTPAPTPAPTEPAGPSAPPPTVMPFPTFPPAYTPSPTATAIATATFTAIPTASATATELPTPDRAATLTAAPIVTPFGGVSDAIAYACEIPGAFNTGVVKLCLMALGGAAPVVLASPGAAQDGGPVWSPDGTRIAFESNPNGQSDLFVVNADGSGKTRLTTIGSTQEANFAPSWSPDGTRIAFICWRVDVEAKLCLIGADGAGRVQLDQPAGVPDGPPAWSPDGTQIAMSFGGQIYLVDARATTPVTPIGPLTEGNSPAWSPDGRRIAYSGPSGLYLIPASGSGTQPAKLTEGEGIFTRPAWSPDGRRIAFVAEVEDNKELYVVNAGGSGQTRLTDDLTDIADSSTIGWSPDGERLVYVCGSDLFNSDLCLINADGSGHTVLTVNRLLDLEPAWRP